MDKVKIVLKETTAEVQNALDRVCCDFLLRVEDDIYYVGDETGLLVLVFVLSNMPSFVKNVVEWKFCYNNSDFEDDIFATLKNKGILANEYSHF
jgi:hypothetical protein